MVKKILFTLYILVMLCMGMTTIIEKYKGSDFVSEYVYGSWWFTALWTLSVAVGILYFVKSKVRRLSIVTLHISFVVILLGALLTHMFSEQGMIRLRKGEAVDTYLVQGKGGNVEEHKLPFSMKLNSFDVKYHQGTDAVEDYESKFTITDGSKTINAKVSMNNIFSYRSVRFYQASYDRDLSGSILSLNSDPYGIAVTYVGYALLFVSLLWMLFDANGPYRRLLRSEQMKKAMFGIALLFGFGLCSQAAPVLPKETAEKFGELNILYNDRICTVQKFAIDFTKKLYGSSTYKDFTPEQVLTGWIFWGEDWSKEPMLKFKNGPLKETLQMPDYTSVNAFFNRDLGGYVIGPYVQEYYQGNHDKFHQQVADIDDRIQLTMELRRGTLLKIFPYTYRGKTVWYAPTEKIPASVEKNHRIYMQNVFLLLYDHVLAGDYAKVYEIFGKMARYQKNNGGTSLPSDSQIRAERIYNQIPFATILFMLNLSMGFVMFFFTIRKLIVGKSLGRGIDNTVTVAGYSVMTLSFVALTFCEVLRWIIGGTVPMANGYETMLFVAWTVMLLSLFVSLRFRIVLTFGFLMSGFFLLVSHISQMDPQISHIMPVLNSPLLSVHVSIIMLGFALLSLTFICGLTALFVRMLKRHSEEQLSSLRLLSLIFLYPALVMLGFGIFIGAIWANVSWGQYWSWDPKEVWALITLMVYAIAVHSGTLPSLRRPLVYHAFVVLAFLTILMTYFGVNYFLGGMHSYA